MGKPEASEVEFLAGELARQLELDETKLCNALRHAVNVWFPGEATVMSAAGPAPEAEGQGGEVTSSTTGGDEDLLQEHEPHRKRHR